MKKTKSIFALFAFLLALGCGISFGQKIDITGTWVGETEVPDAPEPDKITLIIEKVEGKYKGTVSDSMEMVQEAECEDIELKDSELSFNFIVFTGEVNLRIYATLTVEGDTMTGFWESEEGDSSSLELKRQKNKLDWLD